MASPDQESHYDTLGLDSSADGEAIRRAYHHQARQWHPDRFAGKPAAEAERAEQQMRRVNEAFRVLGEPARRRAYDSGRTVGATQGRVHTDADGATRIDPRLLDRQFLDARRRAQEHDIETMHGHFLRILPWLALLGLLAGIFIFTAYAQTSSSAQPATTLPGPDIGFEANECVRLLSDDQMMRVPNCQGVVSGRVIGARYLNGTCPVGTIAEVLAGDKVVCIGPA